MKNMTLEAITKACHGQQYGCISGEISSVVIDSRKVQQGSLFIATRGNRTDGHDYIETAIESGAAAVVCEKAPVDVNIPYILVPDSFQALKEIAIYYRDSLNIKVVGITGSVGKTSTKEFIASVLSQHYKV